MRLDLFAYDDEISLQHGTCLVLTLACLALLYYIYFVVVFTWQGHCDGCGGYSGGYNEGDGTCIWMDGLSTGIDMTRGNYISGMRFMRLYEVCG